MTMCRFLAVYLVLLFQEQGGKLVLGTCRQQMCVLSPECLAFGGQWDGIQGVQLWLSRLPSTAEGCWWTLTRRQEGMQQMTAWRAHSCVPTPASWPWPAPFQFECLSEACVATAGSVQ